MPELYPAAALAWRVHLPACGVGVHLPLQPPPLTARGLLFHRLAEQAVAVAPAPYRAITGKLANPADSEGSGQ